MVVNYNNGKIYKIVCDTTGLQYVGSTTREFLSSRLNGHRVDYKRWKNDNTNKYLTSFKVLENDNFKIVLLESVSCNRKDELFARERYHIESTDCVNKYIPNRTMQEYQQAHKESMAEKKKIYYEAHKESMAEYQKEYNQKNRDLISKKKREKNAENRDEINKKERERYAKKKVKYMERYPLLFPK